MPDMAKPADKVSRAGRSRFQALYAWMARRRAEEGPLWGSDPGDAHRAGHDALTAGSTVASPQAGPLLHVPPAPPGAGQWSAGCAVLTRACTVASRKRVPAPRSGASAILAATPRGLARFWPAATCPVHACFEARPCRGSRVAKTVTAQRVFHYVRRSKPRR